MSQSHGKQNSICLEYTLKTEHEKQEDRRILVQAACILMAADPALSPQDAVADAYQVYTYVQRLPDFTC